jgi:DNA-directed RNA polymerase subunit M/transcription elongation factor TFIIS
MAEDKQHDKPTCPECGNQLMLIYNERMDEQIERIPLCVICKRAWRVAELGWQIMDVDNNKEDQC